MHMLDFAKRIEAFNDMYRLPTSFSPVLSWDQASKNRTGTPDTTPDTNAVHEAWARQVTNFLNIMREELSEVDDILELIEDEESDEMDVLTAVADWLGDIVVYCMSEATKYGVSDYIPNIVYCDHAAVGSIYGSTDDIEAALLAIGEGLNQEVAYNEGVLVGQPSAKNMAKFLTSIISRCFHESEHFGFEMYEVLKIIMDSNMSKLGEDGQPIYDERGKVMKGPNYWKSEPKIRAYLASIYVVDDEEEGDEEDEDMEDGEDDDRENA